MSMEDLTQQFEAEAEGGELPQVEEQQQPEAAEGDAGENESLARKLGWRPRDEYDKDDGKWMDADAFIEMRQGTAKTTQRLNQVVREQERKIRRLEKMVEQVRGFKEQARQEALDELKEKMRAAAETGDMEAFDRVDAKLEALRKDTAAEVEAKKPVGDMQKIYTEWLAENRWYAQGPMFDQAKFLVAEDIIAELGPMPESDLSPQEYLEEITERVAKRFPVKEEPKARKPNPVAGANGMRVQQKAVGTYAGLSQEDKHMAQQMVKAGIFASVEECAKEFAKNV